MNAQWHPHLESLGNKRDHGLRNVQGSEPEKVEILNDDLSVSIADGGDGYIKASEAGAVSYTVAGVDADATATVTFSGILKSTLWASK